MFVCGLYAGDLVIHAALCEDFMSAGISPPCGRALRLSSNSAYGRFLLGSSNSGSLAGGGSSTAQPSTVLITGSKIRTPSWWTPCKAELPQ